MIQGLTALAAMWGSSGGGLGEGGVLPAAHTLINISRVHECHGWTICSSWRWGYKCDTQVGSETSTFETEVAVYFVSQDCRPSCISSCVWSTCLRAPGSMGLALLLSMGFIMNQQVILSPLAAVPGGGNLGQGRGAQVSKTLSPRQTTTKKNFPDL